MGRGGTGLRRRFITPIAVCVIAIATAATASAPVATAAGGDYADPTLGEAGSGPAPTPLERPPLRTARGASFAWSDLDADDAWARRAIDHVARTNDWMRDFAARSDGSVPFRPDRIQTRRYLARAVVKAFAPGEAVDPTITFSDLEPSDPFYQWANIAVQHGWLRRAGDGRFQPDRAVTMRSLHATLIDVLGMRRIARQLDRLRTRDGTRIPTPPKFGATMLGMRLGLRFNNRHDTLDVAPRTPLTRAQVAYSLSTASSLPSWVVPWVRDQYDGIVLPNMSEGRLDIVRWGVRFVGYPYVWGGEWGGKRPPAALGGQPVPGFDCSGLVWWLIRKNDGNAWDVHPPRPYAGWTLNQRTSADMSRIGRLNYDRLRPGDLMFYDGDGDRTVDHVDVYIGNGYALDSSNTPGGVTIMWVGDGWYREHFVHGRRVLRKD